MVYLKDPWLVRCRLQYTVALSDRLSRNTLLTTIFMLTIFSYMLPLIQLIRTPSMLPCLGYHRASQKYRTGWQNNYLKLNQEKTEFFIPTSSHHMQNVSHVLLKVGKESITPAGHHSQSRCHFWCSNDSGCSHQIFVHQSELPTAQYFENPAISVQWNMPSNSSGLDFIAYGLWQWIFIVLQL